MPRHRVPRKEASNTVPEWAKHVDNPCLSSIVEEVYMSRWLAVQIHHADRHAACAELLRAAEKSITTMADNNVGVKARCAAGERALRKFWEAKVCAKRCEDGSSKHRRAAPCD